MSTRNYDAKRLTELKRDRNEAAFFDRARQQANAAQTGVFVPQFNPQTGMYDSSKFAEISNGVINVFYRASPATIISLSPTYLDVSGNAPVAATQNVNVPIYQPVNDCSPVQ
jgi:hypothetical protein